MSQKPATVTASCCQTGQIVVRRYPPRGWQMIATAPKHWLAAALRDHAKRGPDGMFYIQGMNEATSYSLSQAAYFAFRDLIEADLSKSLNRQTGGLFKEPT